MQWDSRIDPERIQPMRSVHVIDRHGQWAKCVIGCRLSTMSVFSQLADDPKIEGAWPLSTHNVYAAPHSDLPLPCIVGDGV